MYNDIPITFENVTISCKYELACGRCDLTKDFCTQLSMKVRKENNNA